MRRLIDLLVAIPAGLVALPLAAVVALLVLMVMGRPLLFRQARSGRDGNPFTLLKFRTMRAAAPGADPLGDDAGRTPLLGHVLRRLRLDELPQLLNVVRGHMGIIGPRPLLPQTMETLGERGRRRGAIRPGLTGWAQVNGGPVLSDDDKIALDLWYVENRDARLDLRILLRTLGVLVLGDRVHPAAVEYAHAGHRRRRS